MIVDKQESVPVVWRVSITTPSSTFCSLVLGYCDALMTTTVSQALLPNAHCSWTRVEWTMMLLMHAGGRLGSVGGSRASNHSCLNALTLSEHSASTHSPRHHVDHLILNQAITRVQEVPCCPLYSVLWLLGREVGISIDGQGHECSTFDFD